MTPTHSPLTRALATITITTVSVAALLTLLPTMWTVIVGLILVAFAGLFLLAMIVGMCIAAGDMDEEIARRQEAEARHATRPHAEVVPIYGRLRDVSCDREDGVA